jgi:Mce-associated membrane protein
MTKSDTRRTHHYADEPAPLGSPRGDDGPEACTALSEADTATGRTHTDSDDAGEGADPADSNLPTAASAATGALRTFMAGVQWPRVIAYGALPAVALMLALAAGFFKWQDSSVREADLAGIESVQAARDATVAMLSYKPDTVDKQLGAARDLLTGPFRDSYASLTNDVVIPGAKQKQISATASVAAAAPISADLSHAEALVLVNQTIVVGGAAPTESTSSVKVGLTKVDGRWLISSFDPT